MFLVTGDIAHSFVWLVHTAIVFMEWSRSIRPWKFNRVWYLLSLAGAIIKIWSLSELHKRDPLDHPEQWKINFWNNLTMNYVTTCFYGVLALVGIIGGLPKIRNYLEPNQAQAKKLEKGSPEPTDEEKQPTAWELIKLITGPGSRLALLWLVIGMASAGGKGFITQRINFYDGQVFNAARNDNTSLIMETLKMTATLYGCMSVLSGVAMAFANVGAEKIINGTNGIRNKLFRILLSQEMAYHDKLSSGEIASRFSNDAERVRVLLAEVLPVMMENLALVCFGLYFLFTTSWSLTLYMLGLVPLTFGANIYQAQKLEAYVIEGMTQNALMSGRIQEVFSKITTVITYGKRDFETRAYKKVIANMFAVLRAKIIFSGVIFSVSGFLAFSTQVLAFFLGVELFKVKSFGDFMTFCLYAMNVMNGLIEVVKLIPTLGEAIGGAGAVLKMLERRPRAPEFSPVQLLDLNVTKGEIEFRNVTFAYPNNPERVALNGISFKVARNTKVALIGDSGAGKSTILQMIARFYDPTAGSVLIDGQDIKNCSVQSVRKNIGMVRQDADLFATSILENIAYGRGDPSAHEDNVKRMEEALIQLDQGADSFSPPVKRIVDEVMHAAEQAHAEDFVRNKLTMVLGEGGKGLSGGQKQRVTVARALYKDPKILLLDEVTSALDQVSEAQVQRAIDRLVKDRTVLIVAHRLHTIQNADKILILTGGKIVAEGNHDSLMATSAKYREMVHAAKRQEEDKHKDTKASRALALVKEIHEKIHADPEMQVLTLKLRELIETAEEQERKVLKASLSVSSDSSLLVSAGTAAVAKDKARADVEEPLIPGLMSPESSSPVDRSIMSDDEMSTSPSSGVKMSRIAERPAPPIPSDDEEGF
jgi:ABC-type multidrug transport system fused ATPase/permease subunit